MDNFSVYLPLVDGSIMDCINKDISGKSFIHQSITDDFGAPPKRLCIEVISESGKKICIHIPYDDNSNASVTVDGKDLN